MNSIDLIRDGHVIEPSLWAELLRQIQKESQSPNYTEAGFGVGEMKRYTVLVMPDGEFVASCGILQRTIFPPDHYRFLNRLYTFRKFRNLKGAPLWCMKHLLNGHIASLDRKIAGFISRENLQQTRVLDFLKDSLNRYTDRSWLVAPEVYRVGPGKGASNFQRIVYFNLTGQPLGLQLKPTAP